LPENGDGFGFSIPKWRETLYLAVKHIPGSISKILNKLAVTVVLWIEITVFLLFSMLPLMPKNVDGFGLVIPKLREITLFYMSNKFLENF